MEDQPIFIVIRSKDSPYQKLGNLMIIQGPKILFKCKTLELPYRDNKKNVSCVPDGTYRIVKELSPRFGMCWELKGVPNRSEVKIHQGNYFSQIEGCILVGDMHLKINQDEEPDVRNSIKTKLKMERIMDDLNINETTITFIDIPHEVKQAGL